MSNTVKTIRLMNQHIIFNPKTQEFLDKDGNDKKHFKTRENRWNVSIRIDKKQYTVSAHQYIYSLNNPHLETLPILGFIGDYNDLQIDNIRVKNNRFESDTKREESTKTFKIYFTNKSERDKANSLLNANGFKCSSSNANLKRRNHNIKNKEIKEKSNGLFPIRCEPERLIAIAMW